MPVTNIDITDVDHEARITANESSITTLNGTVSGLSTAVNNPITGLSATYTLANGHTTQITTINGTLVTLSSDLSNLTSEVATNTSDIGIL